MSEAEVGTEGGGAPLPPKRPTIIRPMQDGRGPAVPARPAPARPAPPPPGSRSSPSVTKMPTAADAAGSSAAVAQRPSEPIPSPNPNKRPDPPAKEMSKPKSQGSVRKRPEITIVDVRPMSQAGFREVKVLDKAPVAEPVNSMAKNAETPTKFTSNGVTPAIPSRPPPATTVTHSTPPPSQPPPPVPTTRPGGPLPVPLPHPEKPPTSNNSPETSEFGQPPKPSRPTILRPSRPKSAIVASESTAEENKTSPPPPLPKRSPIVSEAAAPGDLINLNPPPKPARSTNLGEESHSEEAKDNDNTDEGRSKAIPKKPSRASVIRPTPRQRPSGDEERATTKTTDEPQEGSTQQVPQQPPRPKPPVPPSRPVAVVAASPKEPSPTHSPRSDDTKHSGTSPPPVPAVRPKSSPRDPTQSELTEQKPPLSDTSVHKPSGVPDRPKPPVPPSRPLGSPSAASSEDGSPRLPEPLLPSKLPVSSAHSSGSSGGGSGLPPPLVPSKPPPPAGAVHSAEDSLYAVSEPLENSLNALTCEASVPSAHQPSRPPPPVPKTRPQPAPPSPMMGRPLPSLPSQSSSESPSSEKGHLYEDVDSVRAQTPAHRDPLQTESNLAQKSDLSPRKESCEVSAPVIDPEDISALYAKVNKPKKKDALQSSETNVSQPENVTSNPFGVKLKHVSSEGMPEAETLSQSENTGVKKPPVLASKPKPGVLPKPQPAAKPKSPRKEEKPSEITAVPPEAAAKPSPAEQSKPPLSAKRPTIIRSSRPPPNPGDMDQKEKSEEDNTDVQLRGKRTTVQPRPQSELIENEESKTSVVQPPVPSKRPVTIIGFPHQRQKPPESETGEKVEKSSPVPRQRRTPGEVSPRSESTEFGGLVSKEDLISPSESVKVQPSPPVSRPPPPRPDNRTAKPSPPLEPAARKESDPEKTPPGPPSPAPPRPAARPAPPKEDGPAEGAPAVPSTPRFTPPIKRKEASTTEEEEVTRGPARPGGPPPRPGSMPPVKPPLSVAPKSPSAATEVKSEKPARPQPVRPMPPKEAKSSSPPPLPQRPGLTHPLYGYMAGQPHAIALHDYPASQQDELPFQEGDTVVLVKRVDEQWLMGKVGDKEGIFPQNFVNIIHPLHDELPVSAIDDFIDGAFEDALHEKPDLLQGPRCRARFDFDGEGEGDLNFEDGDVIQLLARCGEDWLKGELNGKVGMFPASFVEIIEDLPEEKGGHDVPRGKGSEVTALFDFSGEAGELSFQAGDKICILSKVNEQWLFGQCAGHQGSFPASFVDVIPLDLPLHESDTASQSPADIKQSSQLPEEDSHDKPKRFCTALFSFEKTQEGDLEFREGDRIEIVEEMGQDWVRGRLDGREGMFPASFVQHEDGTGPSLAVDSSHTMNSTGLDSHAALVMGRALFDFSGETDSELTFKAGDEIILGSMVSEGSEWQWGELHGKKGMFPGTFVEIL